MPEIKISTHTHESVRTVRNTVQADGITVSDHSDFTVETIRARFEIIGGEPFTRKGRSTQVVRPEALKVVFRSTNGDPWTHSYGVSMTGSNVKKDGSLGAEVEINRYDFPDWVGPLVNEDTVTWVNGEYPR